MNSSFQLDSVIQVLLSSDNQRRIQAQAYIDQLPKTNFDQGIDAFLLTMNHENPQVAMMAALLLKKKYLDAKQNFTLISKNKLELIVHSVQNMLVPEKPYNFLKRCCEILVKIFTYADQKKELISIVQGMATSEANNMKLALMYLIEIICEFAFDDQLLMENAAAMDAIFQRGFADQNNQIKVATFKTLTIFLSSINDQKLINKFAGVLQTITTKAIQLIKFDQESGVTAIESMNQLIEAHPKFIKPILNDLLMIFTQIMETPKLLTNLRISAMHGVLVLSMNHTSLIRKNKYFKTKMVESYMKMLAEINEMSLQEWAVQLNDEIISKNNISMSTQEHLYNILNELGNKFLLPLFIPYIQQCLASNEISYQHAGLTALAILTQDCHESFKSQLKELLALIMPLLSSTNPLIIHDILIAMGYMSQEFAPQIQINFGQLILKFICLALVHPYPKVQYGAVLCIQNFEKGLQGEEDVHVIEPFLDEILGQISKIFENSLSTSNYLMLEGVLDTLGTVASISPFAKYYPTFMPGLKKIFQMITPDTPQKSSLRNKAIETIGFLLSSVKGYPDLFNHDCTEIMNELMTLQSNLPIEDVTHRPIYVVYENVVECIGEGFSTYSDFVMPRATVSAMRKVEFHVIDQTQVDKHQKSSTNKMIKMKLDLKIDGVKNLVLNTDTLEQKIEASNLLSSMAEYMKGSFFKYADSMVPVLLQLISYKSSKQIRMNMLEIIQHMVTNAPQQHKITLLNALWNAMTSELVTLIKTKDHASVSAMVRVMSNIFPFLSAEMQAKLPQMMQAVLSLVKSLTNQIQKIYADKQMDEDMSEEMVGQIDEVEEVLEYVQKIMDQGKFIGLKAMFPKDYEFGANQE